MSGHTEMSKDAWRYTKAPKPGDLKDNRYLNPKNGELSDDKPKSLEGDFLTIGPLACYDSKGNCFEQYDKIDFALKARLQPQAYDAETVLKKFNDEESFLPSFALSCAALVWLYEHREDASSKNILDQYDYQPPSCGIHLQNTMLMVKQNRLIHYPDRIVSVEINQQHAPFELPFSARGYSPSLANVLANKRMRPSLKNLTGLKNPEILVDIASYFGKEGNFWLPREGETGLRITELGCEKKLEFITNSFFDKNWILTRDVRIVGGNSK